MNSPPSEPRSVCLPWQVDVFRDFKAEGSEAEGAAGGSGAAGLSDLFKLPKVRRRRRDTPSPTRILVVGRGCICSLAVTVSPVRQSRGVMFHWSEMRSLGCLSASAAAVPGGGGLGAIRVVEDTYKAVCRADTHPS